MEQITSKQLYRSLSKEQRAVLPVLTVHYKTNRLGVTGTSIEDCGLDRYKIIKQDKSTVKVFSLKYNRKELLRHAITE